MGFKTILKAKVTNVKEYEKATGFKAVEPDGLETYCSISKQFGAVEVPAEGDIVSIQGRESGFKRAGKDGKEYMSVSLRPTQIVVFHRGQPATQVSPQQYPIDEFEREVYPAKF